MPEQPILSLREIEKIYGKNGKEVHALRGVSLDVFPGEIFGIIGPSGAGKSTLIRCINLLEAPQSGRVLIDGADVTNYRGRKLREVRRNIGMVFQHFNLLTNRTAAGNVSFPMEIVGVPKAERIRRVNELLSFVGLQDKAERYPAELSGGEKQRVGIARALAMQPRILLCDEATSALDPETTLSILQLLKDINRRLGITIVLITHEMSVIREICDEVLVLEQGVIAEAGPVWRVFGNPQHPATKALLQPLSRDLPEDVAINLRPHGGPLDETVIELAFTGEGGLEPDLVRIASAVGSRARVIQSTLDRIDGHVHGRLLIGARGAHDDLEARLASLAHSVRILGHVPANA